MTEQDINSYDLHITVNPETLDFSCIVDPWKVLDIRNTQGAPHCIVSRKYTGEDPRRELECMAEELRTSKARVQRKKIELHFHTRVDALRIRNAVGIVEIHYKYKQRGMFSVNVKQIEELNRKKFAFSFNADTQRRIISARFIDLAAYELGKAVGTLPFFLAEEEREIVVWDTNNELDTFWPLRTSEDSRLEFVEFPQWILQA